MDTDAAGNAVVAMRTSLSHAEPRRCPKSPSPANSQTKPTSFIAKAERSFAEASRTVQHLEHGYARRSNPARKPPTARLPGRGQRLSARGPDRASGGMDGQHDHRATGQDLPGPGGRAAAGRLPYPLGSVVRLVPVRQHGARPRGLRGLGGQRSSGRLGRRATPGLLQGDPESSRSGMQAAAFASFGHGQHCAPPHPVRASAAPRRGPESPPLPGVKRRKKTTSAGQVRATLGP